jgi:hypothetical protein
MIILVLVDVPSPLPPLPPSPSPAPSASSQRSRASKGKGREEPEDVPESPQASPVVAARPYGLRGTKRRADPDPPAGPAAGSAGSQSGEEEETTPRKGDVPQGADIPAVHVDSPSPPRPTRRARTDDGGTVAVGMVSTFNYLSFIMYTYFPSRTCVALAGLPKGRSAGHRPDPGVQRLPVSFAPKRRRLVSHQQNGLGPSLTH